MGWNRSINPQKHPAPINRVSDFSLMVTAARDYTLMNIVTTVKTEANIMITVQLIEKIFWNLLLAKLPIILWSLVSLIK
jgi:hypothetical protein